MPKGVAAGTYDFEAAIDVEVTPGLGIWLLLFI
jgi:hypothetical protein